MDPVIIKKGKKTYAFYSDEIVITKKNEVVRKIRHEEIDEITYNPKFGLADWIGAYFPPAPGGECYQYKAFLIYLKPKRRIVGVRLSNDEFERIKDTFKIPVRIV